MKYYSLAKEDEFINNNFFKNKKNGIYLELGAYDGIIQSNTKFYEDEFNWTGILIESNVDSFELLKKNRPNNYLFNELVSNETEELEYKCLTSVGLVGGVSKTLPTLHNDFWYGSFKDKNNYNEKIIKMKPKSLTDIIKSTNLEYIDFFSLDVEGHEHEVLLSWDFSIPIYLILIETLGRNKEEQNKDELCRKLLLKNGYKFVTKCAHNEIFILKDSYLDSNI